MITNYGTAVHRMGLFYVMVKEVFIFELCRLCFGLVS